MASGNQAAGDQRVALVIQRRIADEGFADFTKWSGKVADALKSWPGFLSQEVAPPQPPANLDWVQVLRFATPAAARAWLRSDARAQLVEEISRHCIGPEDVHILQDVGGDRTDAISAIISFHVPPDREAAFLDWQQRVQAAESQFKGFLRHKIEGPIAGLHDDWVVILSFDADANLNAWLDSPQRRALLAEGGDFNAGLTVKRASYGFNFWFPAGQPAAESPSFIFKSNMLVLLVLYPIVFLWGYFISGPFIDSRGAPFWLSLFIGNVASTQLLGWKLAPLAFKTFGWWIQPDVGWRKNLLGYGVLVALYALSMAVYAGLLAWNWGKG